MFCLSGLPYHSLCFVIYFFFLHLFFACATFMFLFLPLPLCNILSLPCRLLQLPGVEACQNYQFRYGRHPLMELPLMINPSGSARSEPKVPTQCKR